MHRSKGARSICCTTDDTVREKKQLSVASPQHEGTLLCYAYVFVAPSRYSITHSKNAEAMQCDLGADRERGIAYLPAGIRNAACSGVDAITQTARRGIIPPS